MDMASEANVTVVSPNIVMSKATSTTRRIFRTDQNVWACSRQVRAAPTERARGSHPLWKGGSGGIVRSIEHQGLSPDSPLSPLNMSFACVHRALFRAQMFNHGIYGPGFMLFVLSGFGLLVAPVAASIAVLMERERSQDRVEVPAPRRLPGLFDSPTAPAVLRGLSVMLAKGGAFAALFVIIVGRTLAWKFTGEVTSLTPQREIRARLHARVHAAPDVSTKMLCGFSTCLAFLLLFIGMASEFPSFERYLLAVKGYGAAKGRKATWRETLIVAFRYQLELDTDHTLEWALGETCAGRAIEYDVEKERAEDVTIDSDVEPEIDGVAHRQHGWRGNIRRAIALSIKFIIAGCLSFNCLLLAQVIFVAPYGTAEVRAASSVIRP